MDSEIPTLNETIVELEKNLEPFEQRLKEAQQDVDDLSDIDNAITRTQTEADQFVQPIADQGHTVAALFTKRQAVESGIPTLEDRVETYKIQFKSQNCEDESAANINPCIGTKAELKKYEEELSKAKKAVRDHKVASEELTKMQKAKSLKDARVTFLTIRKSISGSLELAKADRDNAKQKKEDEEKPLVEKKVLLQNYEEIRANATLAKEEADSKLIGYPSNANVEAALSFNAQLEANETKSRLEEELKPLENKLNEKKKVWSATNTQVAALQNQKDKNDEKPSTGSIPPAAIIAPIAAIIVIGAIAAVGFVVLKKRRKLAIENQTEKPSGSALEAQASSKFSLASIKDKMGRNKSDKSIDSPAPLKRDCAVDPKPTKLEKSVKQARTLADLSPEILREIAKDKAKDAEPIIYDDGGVRYKMEYGSKYIAPNGAWTRHEFCAGDFRMGNPNGETYDDFPVGPEGINVRPDPDGNLTYYFRDEMPTWGDEDESKKKEDMVSAKVGGGKGTSVAGRRAKGGSDASFVPEEETSLFRSLFGRMCGGSMLKALPAPPPRVRPPSSPLQRILHQVMSDSVNEVGACSGLDDQDELQQKELQKETRVYRYKSIIRRWLSKWTSTSGRDAAGQDEVVVSVEQDSVDVTQKTVSRAQPVVSQKELLTGREKPSERTVTDEKIPKIPDEQIPAEEKIATIPDAKVEEEAQPAEVTAKAETEKEKDPTADRKRKAAVNAVKADDQSAAKKKASKNGSPGKSKKDVNASKKKEEENEESSDDENWTEVDESIKNRITRFFTGGGKRLGNKQLEAIISRLSRRVFGKKKLRRKIATIYQIMDQVIEAFKAEPMLVETEFPCSVITDIHADVKTLMNIFRSYGGEEPAYHSHRFILCGDYCDRGRNSLQVLMLLFAIKLRYPHMVLLRGNHEDPEVNSRYGFHEEIYEIFGRRADFGRRKCKEAENLIKKINSVYAVMPLAARIGGVVYCSHGGFPKLEKGEDLADVINAIRRPLPNPALNKHALQILWGDPGIGVKGFEVNYIRGKGTGDLYGPDTVVDLCANQKLDLLVRGHQKMELGYEYFAGNKLLTIFSCAKYLDHYNSGSVLDFANDARYRLREYRNIGEMSVAEADQDRKYHYRTNLFVTGHSTKQTNDKWKAKREQEQAKTEKANAEKAREAQQRIESAPWHGIRAKRRSKEKAEPKASTPQQPHSMRQGVYEPHPDEVSVTERGHSSNRC